MEKLVALLFMDRTLAHIEHLRTKSYATHMALGSFYEEIIPLADKLAEAYQGFDGLMDISFIAPESKGTIEETLSKRVLEIEKLRKTCNLSAIQNIIDEIIGLYLSTVYKLRYLS